MSGDLLQTKLYVPRLRMSLVPRPRLIEKLNQGLHRKLTLISAPAGFGKTTLVLDWIQRQERPVAWLSLDKNDQDPRRFLTYLVAAIQNIQPDFGEAALHLLQEPGQELTRLLLESLLTIILNEMIAVATPLTLILDDYHVIESPAVNDAVSFLINHLPPPIHLIIISRTKPGLPLSRLRARGEFCQVGLQDLRFTAEESAHFLNELMGLNLSPSDNQALTVRTEGWIAGLQLAALSMRETSDTAAFVATFSGSDRYILDYLMDEVLNQRPESVRRFLLQTAVLNRLCGRLCDVMTGRQDSQQTLEQLETANLFLLPLDNKRHWYRYHTLFGDLLRDRLQRAHPDWIPALHRRAGQWYAANSLPTEAIHHMLVAEDYDAAIQLIEAIAPDHLVRGEVGTLRDWLQALPAESVHYHPRLSVTLAWIRLLTGEFEGLKSQLLVAEQSLMAVESARREQLQTEIVALRAVIAVEQGETAPGLEWAQQAHALLTADVSDYGRFLRGTLASTLGLAYRDSGHTSAATQAYAEARVISESGDSVLAALMASYELGQLYLEQGQLRQAEQVHRHALQMAEERFGGGAATLPLSGAAHVGLGWLLYEWNRLDEARDHLETGVKRTQQKGGLGLDRDGLLALSLVYQAQGDSLRTEKMMAQAEAHARRSPRPDALLRVRPFQVRLWLAQNKLAPARQWAEQQFLDAASPGKYPVEMTTVAVARVHIAQKQPEQALDLLDRLLPVVERNVRTGRVIEILALLALAHHQLGQPERALPGLKRGLSLAKPEGYVRLFLDMGQPMAQLLYMAVQRNIVPEYAGRLLKLFAGEYPLPRQTDNPDWIEPLSERELEVLQLIATGLTNREIGLRLHLSPNTIKRHTLNIYEKLGVHSRTEAVTTARNFGILS
ncbi:MAG: tetratricopeptide repeat protein [Anaerolineales bacterium]|nr:tetratricopeptide repeat protein [Anaerolineales bacterium]MCB8954556.1 tetratricopeptide repeat protein [Ardenticatenales bacterium]